MNTKNFQNLFFQNLCFFLFKKFFFFSKFVFLSKFSNKQKSVAEINCWMSSTNFKIWSFLSRFLSKFSRKKNHVYIHVHSNPMIYILRKFLSFQPENRHFCFQKIFVHIFEIFHFFGILKVRPTWVRVLSFILVIKLNQHIFNISPSDSVRAN